MFYNINNINYIVIDFLLILLSLNFWTMVYILNTAQYKSIQISAGNHSGTDLEPFKL